jgi:hypothetical protein
MSIVADQNGPLKDSDKVLVVQDGWPVPIPMSQVKSYAGSGFNSGVVAQSANPSTTLTGTVNKTSMVSIPIPASIAGNNGKFVLYYSWSATNNANNKTVSFQLDGNDLGISDTRASNVWTDGQVSISNRGTQQSQLVSIQILGSHTTAIQTLAVDLSAATKQLNIYGQLANSADSMRIESYSLVVYPNP